MRFVFALLLLLAPTPPPVTLQVSSVEFGVLFTVQSDAPRHFYAQVDGTPALIMQGDTIFEFDLEAGQTFARTIPIAAGVAPGVATVRVWASDGITVEQRLAIPARAGVLHGYVPLLLH